VAIGRSRRFRRSPITKRSSSAMGGISPAQRFTRYYQLPSVGHCGGGAPDTYPGLRDVVRWTETSKAPNGIQASIRRRASWAGSVQRCKGPRRDWASGDSHRSPPDQLITHRKRRWPVEDEMLPHARNQRAGPAVPQGGADLDGLVRACVTACGGVSGAGQERRGMGEAATMGR
jgi:hypothetical protein